MIRSIDLVQGRHLFGKNPAQYDRARPGYPAEVYRVLRRRCGLSRETATFEIGAGTGKATRELLRWGAGPLAVIEPDSRCARFLRSSLRPWRDRVRLYVAPFEDVELEEGSFDLGVAATSFHWLSERPALRKVVRFLRPGGWWAMWSNLHGDPTRPTDFTRAVDPLYRGFEVSPVTGGLGPLGLRRYRDERLATLRSMGGFDRASCRVIRWKRTLDTDTVLALNRTFSNIASLPYRRRERFLSELRRVVDGPFEGRVTLNMLTTLFIARRSEHGPGGGESAEAEREGRALTRDPLVRPSRSHPARSRAAGVARAVSAAPRASRSEAAWLGADSDPRAWWGGPATSPQARNAEAFSASWLSGRSWVVGNS